MTQIPEHTICRALGCNKKATKVITDTKGRRQYCCDLHTGKRPVKTGVKK